MTGLDTHKNPICQQGMSEYLGFFSLSPRLVAQSFFLLYFHKIYANIKCMPNSNCYGNGLQKLETNFADFSLQLYIVIAQKARNTHVIVHILTFDDDV